MDKQSLIGKFVVDNRGTKYEIEGFKKAEITFRADRVVILTNPESTVKRAVIPVKIFLEKCEKTSRADKSIHLVLHANVLRLFCKYKDANICVDNQGKKYKAVKFGEEKVILNPVDTRTEYKYLGLENNVFYDSIMRDEDDDGNVGWMLRLNAEKEGVVNVDKNPEFHELMGKVCTDLQGDQYQIGKLDGKRVTLRGRERDKSIKKELLLKNIKEDRENQIDTKYILKLNVEEI